LPHFRGIRSKLIAAPFFLLLSVCPLRLSSPLVAAVTFFSRQFSGDLTNFRFVPNFFFDPRCWAPLGRRRCRTRQSSPVSDVKVLLCISFFSGFSETKFKKASLLHVKNRLRGFFFFSFPDFPSRCLRAPDCRRLGHRARFLALRSRSGTSKGIPSARTGNMTSFWSRTTLVRIAGFSPSPSRGQTYHELPVPHFISTFLYRTSYFSDSINTNL